MLTQLDLNGQKNNEVSSISIGDKILFYSDILEESREIFIHQPKGFWGMDNEMTNLPIVIVLDGESQFLNTVATIDFLSSAPYGNDFIPRSIVIGIPNTNRVRDLTPIKGIIANDSSTLEITGGGKLFLDFITKELIPYIDANYSTSNHRTIIGHSLGGLITFEALLRKREFFENYISIDPAFGFSEESFLKEVIDTLNNSNLSKENVFFSAANSRPTFVKKVDLLKDNSDVMKLIDIPNQRFLTEVDSNQWQVNLTSKYYADENHFSVSQRSTYDAMRFFYEYYTFPEIMDFYHPKYKNETDLIERIKDHYEMISTKMGYKVFPMESYLNSYALGMAQSGRQDLAIELFEYNIKLHPTNPVVYNNFASYYRSIGNKIRALELYKQSILLNADEWVMKTIETLEQEMTEHNKRR